MSGKGARWKMRYVCLIGYKGRVGRFWGLDGLLNPCFDEIEGWRGVHCK